MAISRASAGRRLARAALAVALTAGAFASASPAGGAELGPAITAQPAIGSGLFIDWQPVFGAVRYELTVTDSSTGAVRTDSCFACLNFTVPALPAGHKQNVALTAYNLVGAVITTINTVGEPAPDAPPGNLTGITAQAVSGQQAIDVSWSYPTSGVAADSLRLILYSKVNGVLTNVGATWVRRTVEPDAYRIPVPPGTWVVAGTPWNGAGSAVQLKSAAVTVAKNCTGGAICLSVTDTGSTDKVHGVGLGLANNLLNPTTGQPVDATWIDPITPHQWRFSGKLADLSAQRFDVSRTDILSFLWRSEYSAQKGGYAYTPWSDWNRWTNFITAKVAEAKADGWAPDYWDIWNEPNGNCCPIFTEGDAATASAANWVVAYEKAYWAIKAADPDAKIVAPTLGGLRWSAEQNGDPAELDLDTFLDYSAAHGLVWDAISWHENSAIPQPGDLRWGIHNVDHHFDMVEAVLARHPGTVKDNTIFLNEYGSSETHMLAGWQVGYWTRFEKNGVAQANHSCYGTFECSGGGLDGLLTTAGKPTAAWWAHKAYADLAAGTWMQVGSNATWQMDGLATRDDSTNTVRALFGRHWLCNKTKNSWCNQTGSVSAANVNISLDWPYGVLPVTVTVLRLTAGTVAVASPPTMYSKKLTPVNGKITFTLGGVADGDALWVVANPPPGPII